MGNFRKDRVAQRWLATTLCLACAWVLALCGAAAAGGRGWIVEIWKSEHRMEVRDGNGLVREFEIALGRVPVGSKKIQGDKRTPEGRYEITHKHTSARFHRFLGLNYPNIEDADRGYADGLISAGEWAELFVAVAGGRTPPPETLLGGGIGIHGYGPRPYIPVIDWTDGCIAVSNEEAEYLFGVLPLGTPVRIYE